MPNGGECTAGDASGKDQAAGSSAST